MLGHHAANFSGFRHCGSGNETFFKGLCDFMGGSSSW